MRLLFAGYHRQRTRCFDLSGLEYDNGLGIKFQAEIGLFHALSWSRRAHRKGLKKKRERESLPTVRSL